MAEAIDFDDDIRPLNELFFYLSRQLTAGDIDSMKALLRGKQLEKEDAAKVETAMELFNYLEDRGHIDDDNLKLLVVLFEKIGRIPLKEKVVKFLQESNKRKAGDLSIFTRIKDGKPQEPQSIQEDEFFDFIAKIIYCKADLRKRGAFRKIENHLKKIAVLRKQFKCSSIECVVLCEKIDALETLWSQYKSGVLQAVFQKAIITDELLKSLHAEYITMEVTISEEEYRKCRDELRVKEEYQKAGEEYSKARQEWGKAIDELEIAKYEWRKASREVQKSGKERHGLGATEEERKKAEQRYEEARQGYQEADKGRREAYEEWKRKWEAWTSMQASADGLEAANIQIQTMKADAEEQTEKLSKEMDIISEQLKIKGEFRMKELDAKFQFISEQEINDEIRELKSGLERGFTSGVEKATRERISSLEASKITPREYLKLQSDIDSKIIKKKLQIEEERELFHAKEDKSEKESEVMKGISGMKIGRSGKHT